ncbi:hypothetical protein AURDEDRAFT_186565 [Auricularia subglabra TFB-10046 SS5]|uniref:Uncharacterized protein n=1 Tax=Auricularia subglabra (strain TFB-10046 / SS5) TaxID=717982 RepID=J0D2T6_AURST|nr:hypothetical protein AURDEDRAFT_186565 [Auricularia subglabra TFB-10046 SS5]
MGLQTTTSSHHHHKSKTKHTHGSSSSLHPSSSAQKRGRSASPQPPTPQAVTPGGPAHALKLKSDQAFPPASVTGWPPCTDAGGQRVFLGLAPIEDGLHPCKVVEGFVPPVRYSWGGEEFLWDQDYYLVPFDGARMEWAPASHGVTPAGKRLVEGGRESDGRPLYHAVGTVDGVRVLGKAGEHLYGASFPYGGAEVNCDYYEVLCWR